MILQANDLEALKMVADWSKWLITIETGSIAVLGAWVTKEPHSHEGPVRLLITVALGSFVISIAAAAFLLVSLPEIAQTLPAPTSIWLTRDSGIGQLVNLEQLGIAESFFFGLGVVCFAASIIAVLWQGRRLADRVSGVAAHPPEHGSAAGSGSTDPAAAG